MEETEHEMIVGLVILLLLNILRRERETIKVIGLARYIKEEHQVPVSLPRSRSTRNDQCHH